MGAGVSKSGRNNISDRVRAEQTRILYANAPLALAIGGVIAAPLAAWAAKHIPHKPFMVIVGLLIVVINSLRIFKIL